MKKRPDFNRSRIVVEGIFVASIIGISLLLFTKPNIIQYEDKYGYLGVLVLCIICNATLFIPSPSLMVIIAASQKLTPLLVVLCGATGITIGELSGYISGRLGNKILHRTSSTDKWLYRYDWLAVVLLAAVPLPLFDVAGVYSGYSKMNVPKFMVACFFGKLIKVMIYVYGSIAVVDYI